MDKKKIAMRRIIKTSIISLIAVVAFLYVRELITVSLPQYLAAQVGTNDINAIIRCKRILDSCKLYKRVLGFYPYSLAIMGRESPSYLDQETANGISPGYRYYYNKTAAGFGLRVIPLKMDKTGSYIFSANESGELFIFDRHGLVDKKVFEESRIFSANESGVFVDQWGRTMDDK